MKKLLALMLLTAIASGILSGQNNIIPKKIGNKSKSLTGYLVDQNCGKTMVMDDVKKSDARAAKHTRDCGLDESCRASGFGLVTGGKLYRFDDGGNKKAVDYLNATKKEDNIKVEVVGRIDGYTMMVESIKDIKSPRTKGGK